MANYLKGKNQNRFSYHSNRSEGRNVTKGQRRYSRAWLGGFYSLWDLDSTEDISRYKTPFEKTAFKRGRSFVKKILDE